MEDLLIVPFPSTSVPPVNTDDIKTPVSVSEAHSLPIKTDSPTRRSGRKRIIRTGMTDIAHDSVSKVGNSDAEDDVSHKGSGKGGKSRRELPAGAVATLKAWLLSPEHFTHPYPTPQDQILLMQQTGIDKKQLKNWFTNARRRIWKPMLKKQLEQGQIAQTGSGGVVALPAATQGLIGAPSPGTEFVQGTALDQTQMMSQTYQQPLQAPNTQPATTTNFDAFGNPTNYVQHQQTQPSQQTAPTSNTGITVGNNAAQNYTSYFQQGQYTQNQNNLGEAAPQTNVLGSIPNMTGSSAPGNAPLNKTDSHAVLMELFKRDQDLVQQERAKQQRANTRVNDTQVQQQGGGSQHPMSKIAGGSSTQNKMGTVPSLNSWPHFSSVSSLNNLGNMTGVKSITNMSGADLVSQGSLNKKGNLAQVKSIENMGRTDSLAFLEIFFEAGSGSSQAQRGVKREREEDENVGLSLDGDDTSPSPAPAGGNTSSIKTEPTVAPSISSTNMNEKDSKEGLKRAYDDALAARGLISVSRSSEKLTDLALPAKMQRTISQEYLKSVGAGSTTFTSFSFASQNTGNDKTAPAPASTNPYPPTHGFAPQAANIQTQVNSSVGVESSPAPATAPVSDPNTSSVEVPSTTKCAICGQINVDTQLRPCGHMFHGRCLKPSLQQAVGCPKCPIDGILMQSAVLAVPTEESVNPLPTTTTMPSNFYHTQSSNAMPKAEASN